MDTQRLADQIKEAVDAYCAKAYSDERRSHLGASVIGAVCERQLWYAWRWVIREQHDARLLRLFNRGKLEEPRFKEWLEAAGFYFFPVPTLSELGGHFGGTPDGICKKEIDGKEHNFIVEFKTHNTKSFVRLKQIGVRNAKPVHWAQMNVYGYLAGVPLALYFAINKNDDDIHIEVLELEQGYAKELARKAESIITAQSPPPQLPSASMALFECKYCPANQICLNNAMPEDRNCRACRFAVPIQHEAAWACDFHKAIIPPDFIPKGCPDWKAIA